MNHLHTLTTEDLFWWGLLLAAGFWALGALMRSGIDECAAYRRGYAAREAEQANEPINEQTGRVVADERRLP